MKYPIVLFLMISGSIMVMAGGEAKIVFEKTDYDLGTIERGEPAVCQFIFTNEGDKPLKIERTATSCGCLSIDYFSGYVESGESGMITVKYNSNKIGRIGKIIIVVSNSNSYEKTILRIRGNVVPSRGSKIKRFLRKLFFAKR